MKKIDLKKDLKYLYQLSVKGVVLVDTPAMSYLMVDGARGCLGDVIGRTTHR